MTTQTQQRELVRFFGITFAVSWLLWLPGVLRSNGLVNLPEIVGLPGMFVPLVPSVVAFLLVRRAEGRAGVAALARRGIQIGFDKRWLLPAVLLFPVVGLLTVGVLALAGRRPLDGWQVPSVLSVLGTVAYILVAGGGLEEFGWRGYALDRMLQGRSALTASLLLGLVWGLWHLPLHLKVGTTQAAIPIWQFVIQTMVLSVLYTWLTANTRGSVLIAILFHTLGNATAALLPPFFASALGRWVNFGLLLAFTLVVVAVWGPRTLVGDTSRVDQP